MNTFFIEGVTEKPALQTDSLVPPETGLLIGQCVEEGGHEKAQLHFQL